MSTSELNIPKAGKTAFYYLLAAGFWALLGGVYEHFSHGVYSTSMVYAFAYPLVGGAIPFLAMALWCRNCAGGNGLYHCGIATLTLGSILRGVLEIYGTDSRLLAVYPWAGRLLIIAGILLWSFGTFKTKK